MTNQTVTDADGHQYQKVSDAVKIGENQEKVELWERVPPNPEYLYTPTLEWQLHPQIVPSFTALVR